MEVSLNLRLAVLAILHCIEYADSQGNMDSLLSVELCPGQDVSCPDANQVLYIEEVSARLNTQGCSSAEDIRSTTQRCLSIYEIPQRRKALLKQRCGNKRTCTIPTWDPPLEILTNRCSSNDQGRPNDTYHIYVQYTCDVVSDFFINAADMPSRRVRSGTTQRILSPLHPNRMSRASQDITCMFTRSPGPGNTDVRVDIHELQLNGTGSELTIKSDVRTATSPSYSSPIFINETHNINTIIKVANNFSLHFNRCTTVPPGGKFSIAFSVQSDFEMSCTHTFTECQINSTSTPLVIPDAEHESPQDKSTTNIIIGGVIGGVAFVFIVLIIIILILCCKLKRNRQHDTSQVEKREKRKPPPPVARYSSYTDRVSNIYQEIGDEPGVHYYSDIGHVNSIFDKTKNQNYDSRPAPEIPVIGKRPPLDIVNEVEPGYDKIRETKGKAKPEGDPGYAKPKREESYENTDIEEKDGSVNSYSKLMESEKTDSYEKPKKTDDNTAEYTQVNKNGSKNGKNSVNDEGNRNSDLKRFGSDSIMEDNTELYATADDTDDIKLDDVFQTNNNNNSVDNTDL